MFQPQTVSTDDVSPSRRVAYWNDVVGGTLIAQVADPADRSHFSGRMKSLDLGDIRIAEIHADASRVIRTPTHVARAPDPVWLMRLQLAGSVTASYEGQDIHLRPGNFMLYDSTRPYRMLFHEPATILALRVPQKTLVGLEMEGDESVGHGDCVHIGRAQIGVVTSATRSPILKKTIALARLDVTHAGIGTEVEVGKLDGHQKRLPARIVRFPHYDPEKTRVRS